MTLIFFTVNASRQCLLNGTWAHFTDYQECSKHFMDVSTDISLIIYAVGKFHCEATIQNIYNWSFLRICSLILGTLPCIDHFPLI